MKKLSLIFSLFIEKKCYGCGQLGHFFCPKCNESLQLYEEYCYACKTPSFHFNVHESCQKHILLRQIVVLTKYSQKAVKKLLRHAKYYKKYAAYEDIIMKNTSFFQDYLESQNAIIVPVPMHFIRRCRRGYNQSKKISTILGKICDIPVKNIVKRRRYTKQQSRLSMEQRKRNLHGAFSLKKSCKIPYGTVIYLVDDVISTGSTLREITALLQENGYKDVRAVCLASD